MKTAVTVSPSHVRTLSEFVNPQSEFLVIIKHGILNYGQKNVSYEDLS